jgi:hypothetical protein
MVKEVKIGKSAAKRLSNKMNVQRLGKVILIFKKKYPRKPIIGGTFDIFVIFIIKGYYEKIRRHKKVL